MRDVAYDMWAQYVEELCRKHRWRPESVLDVACGTGNTTLPFARRGYRCAGIDASPAMLNIARAKAEAHGLDIEFSRQDMRHLDPAELATGPAFDLVICLYDSLNYLVDPADLDLALPRFRRALKPNGLFIFDVNSARRLSQMTEASIVLEGPGWVFIERNDFEPSTNIWEIRVTGFVETDSEGDAVDAGIEGDSRPALYRRFHEVHRERAYSEDEIRAALERAGLEPLAAYSAFSLEPADQETARIYFVARRPG